MRACFSVRKRYNETRLKLHITDPYRGCRKIPQAIRDRVRNADHRSNPVVHAVHAVLPPAKRKRESVATSTANGLSQAVSVGGEVEPHSISVPLQEPSETHNVQLRISVEFSVSSGALLRASWIASEMIQEFHRDVVAISLIPSATENIFNIWIGGKVAWSRGPGQPLPDYDHLRPLVRAHVVC